MTTKSFTKDINDQDCNLNTSFTVLRSLWKQQQPRSPDRGAQISDVPQGVTGSLIHKAAQSS